LCVYRTRTQIFRKRSSFFPVSYDFRADRSPNANNPQDPCVHPDAKHSRKKRAKLPSQRRSRRRHPCSSPSSAAAGAVPSAASPATGRTLTAAPPASPPAFACPGAPNARARGDLSLSLSPSLSPWIGDETLRNAAAGRDARLSVARLAATEQLAARSRGRCGVALWLSLTNDGCLWVASRGGRELVKKRTRGSSVPRPDPCERPAQAARQVPQARGGPRAESGSGG
jgi:hypothetical protein